MNVALRRTIIGVSTLSTISLVRGAMQAPVHPAADQPKTTHASGLLQQARQAAEHIVAETLGVVAGPVDTASAATPCDPRDTTPNPTYCYRPTPTPTPTPKPTPKPTVSQTPRPTATPRPTTAPTPNTGGGSSGGTGSGGSATGGDCSDTSALDDNPLTAGANCSKANGTSTTLFGQNSVFQTISNTLIYLIGAISVIFLIIGGLRYVISQGDSKATTAAKDTILYAVIGIVVAVISFALVNFVINALSTTAI